MGYFLKNLLNGARQVLVLWPDDDYVRPSRHAFRNDMRLLQGDAKRVARDLYITVKTWQNKPALK